MNGFLQYLVVFAVGGAFCAIAQLLIIRTKLTSARILVIFLVAGIALEAFKVYKFASEFAEAGATIPIIGFGSALAKGAIEGFKEKGLIGALSGGLVKTAAGVSAAILFSYVAAVIFKPHTKKM